MSLNSCDMLFLPNENDRIYLLHTTYFTLNVYILAVLFRFKVCLSLTTIWFEKKTSDKRIFFLKICYNQSQTFDLLEFLQISKKQTLLYSQTNFFVWCKIAKMFDLFGNAFIVPIPWPILNKYCFSIAGAIAVKWRLSYDIKRTFNV